MRVALVQMSATTDKTANFKSVERLVAQAVESRPDLVMLPEAVMHDFGRPEDSLAVVAEPLDGPWVAELQRLARLHEVMIVAGMFESAPEDGRAYNSLVAVDASGSARASTARPTCTTRSATASPTGCWRLRRRRWSYPSPTSRSG